MAPRVRVFIAISLDGFIAGPNDDLSWLPEPDADAPDESGFGRLMAETGCLLMGRNTYAIPEGFEGPWPYGNTPVLVATTRPLVPKVPEVRAMSGTIEELLSEAKKIAQGKDVYVDGGNLIRQALDADLLDLICVTVVPIVLGEGISLFAGAKQRRPLELLSEKKLSGGMVQLTYSVRR